MTQRVDRQSRDKHVYCLGSLPQLEPNMSNKSLAQLEIGSPEWMARREALGYSHVPPRESQPGLLSIGVLAITVGAVFMTAIRLGALLAKRH